LFGLFVSKKKKVKKQSFLFGFKEKSCRFLSFEKKGIKTLKKFHWLEKFSTR
jgi:hypothetical protein